MPSITKSKSNLQQQQAADQSLVDGFTKHASTIPSLLIAGVQVPTTTIISTLQARIAARAATAPAKATYQALVQADQNERASSQALVSGAKQAIGLMYAGQITTLADFGLKPRKAPAPRTPEQKAASAAKAKATRAARHTMGPVQKAQITGATPQGDATPVTPPAPAPAVAPAATPATGVTKS
jgi:hypothetical protein